MSQDDHAANHKTLAQIRDAMRKIDESVMDLLIERRDKAKEIAEMKLKLGLPIVDKKREKENLEANLLYAAGRIPEDVVRKITETLAEWAKETQANRFSKISSKD